MISSLVALASALPVLRAHSLTECVSECVSLSLSHSVSLTRSPSPLLLSLTLPSLFAKEEAGGFQSYD